MAELLAKWRREAIAIITNHESSESLRALAWRFLHEHGVK